MVVRNSRTPKIVGPFFMLGYAVCARPRGVRPGRSAGRPAERPIGRPVGRSSAAPVSSTAPISSTAPKKKTFDRGGPFWPPRSNAKDNRSDGGPGGALAPQPKIKGSGGQRTPAKTNKI